MDCAFHHERQGRPGEPPGGVGGAPYGAAPGAGQVGGAAVLGCTRVGNTGVSFSTPRGRGECGPSRGRARRVGILVVPGLRGRSFSCAWVPTTSFSRVATSWGMSLGSGVLAPFSLSRISVQDKRYSSLLVEQLPNSIVWLKVEKNDNREELGKTFDLLVCWWRRRKENTEQNSWRGVFVAETQDCIDLCFYCNPT